MVSRVALMLTLDVPLLVPDNLTLDQYLGKGLQPDEEAMPEEFATSAPTEPTFDPAALSQLTTMGFPEIRCKKALLAVPGDLEGAMNWLFQHMEDPDIDAPLQFSGKGSAPEPDPGLVDMLQDMGFSPAQAKKALRETVRTTFNVRLNLTKANPQNGDADRAVEWLFNHPDDTGQDTLPSSSNTAAPPQANHGGSSHLPARYRLKAFISHKGFSVHSGHYVAHIRYDGEDGEEWVLFNDEKVVKADIESVNLLRKLAYLYVFERV
jgi:ubiquitin carboxyl-terminal hydrolase 5/13